MKAITPHIVMVPWDCPRAQYLGLAYHYGRAPMLVWFR